MKRKFTLKEQAEMEYTKAQTRAEQQAVRKKYNLSPQWEKKFQREIWLSAVDDEYCKVRQEGRDIDLHTFTLDEAAKQTYKIYFDISSFTLTEEEIRDMEEGYELDEKFRAIPD